MEAFSQPEFVIAETQDELLDELSLQTVLDMSAVMVTAEELTQLENLTPAQKRQVWIATPEDVKLRLKQLKAAAQTKFQPTEPSPEEKGEQKHPNKNLNHLEELDKLKELEEPDESLDEMGEAIDDAVSESLDFLDLPLLQNSYDLGKQSVQSLVRVGDWVVLKAEPRLTKAELIAVWKVVAIQEGQAQIETANLGSRQYPLSWMVGYPEEEPEF